jgi:hypothetical protein
MIVALLTLYTHILHLVVIYKKKKNKKKDKISIYTKGLDNFYLFIALEYISKLVDFVSKIKKLKININNKKLKNQ